MPVTIDPIAGPGRRIKMLEISPDFILDLLQVGEGRVMGDSFVTFDMDAIPDNAKALRAAITERGNIALVIESDGFEECPSGDRPSWLMTTYKSEFISTDDSG